MIKVQTLSDLHLEFGDIKLPRVPADAVVLAGDIAVGMEGVKWAMKTFPKTPVVYVAGNHEFYGHGLPDLIGKLKEATKNSNVHVLEKDAVTINGVTFLGCTLWSDFKLNGEGATWVNATNHAALKNPDFKQDPSRIRLTGPDEDPRRPAYLMPYDACTIHDQSMGWLEQSLKKTTGEVVVVTHHAPATGSVAERFKNTPGSAAFVSNHDEFVASCGVKLWIHGHVHDSFDYRLGDTRVLCNPRGYAEHQENPDFAPALVVPVGAKRRSPR